MHDRIHQKKPSNGTNRIVSSFMIFLVLSTIFFCFLPVIQNGFVWDDEYNLVDNVQYRGFSGPNLAWMFTTFHDRNYHPLSWLSLALDYALWGMNPYGYHFTDLVLHGLNAVLFYLVIVSILKKSTRKSDDPDFILPLGAAAGALFFALHPLRVESVAWISTRGDTLCGFFFMLTILSYLRIDEKDGSLWVNKWFWSALFFFVCSLLSRAWGVTLPIVLLIIDVYPLGRLKSKGTPIPQIRKILTEKALFAVPAGLAGGVALLAKQTSMVPVSQHSAWDRLLQSTYGLCFYPWKTVFPTNLSPFYMLHDAYFGKPESVGSLILTVGITVLLFCLRKQWPWAFIAWICYVIVVSPLLGIVQSGPQMAADRYTYFSCLPYAVLFAAGVYHWLRRSEYRRGGQWIRLGKVFAVSGTLLYLGMLSSGQIHVWRDNMSFWNQIIDLDPRNHLAFIERARLKAETFGDSAGAETDYSRALSLKPDHLTTLVNRGVVRTDLNRYDDAKEDFNRAIELSPRAVNAYNGLGILYYKQGVFHMALENYNHAIALNPEFSDAYSNRGVLYLNTGDVKGAVDDFNKAISIDPDEPEAYANRGLAMLSSGVFMQAGRDFAKALSVAPSRWFLRPQVERQMIDLYARMHGEGLKFREENSGIDRGAVGRTTKD